MLKTIPEVHVATSAADFLRTLHIEHGPPELLGPFFARAIRAAGDVGLTLDTVALDELAWLNRKQRDNWLPIVPTLDGVLNSIDEKRAFGIVARNGSGNVIAAHAARLFDWNHTDLGAELQSLRLFYDDSSSAIARRETCVSTAETANSVAGRVVYSGAAWVHPDHRRRGLTAIVPRIAKALAFTRWQPDTICSLMTTSVHAAGFFKRFAYQHIDWEVTWTNSPLGSLRLAIVWMDMNHLLDDLRSYMTTAAVLPGSGERSRNTG